MALTAGGIKLVAEDLKTEAEKQRKIRFKRRHDIFRDGGKEFLIEQIEKEFGQAALVEMRLAPINVLKKVINKRSMVYSKPVERRTEVESDQALIDYYVEQLNLNGVMHKAEKYWNLHSNTTIYPFPRDFGINIKVCPPHLYSIVPDEFDQTLPRVYIFSAFPAADRIVRQRDVPDAASASGIDSDRQFKTDDQPVAAQRLELQENPERLIWWSDQFHLTTNADGIPIELNPGAGEEQFINPIGIAPVVNLAKDRDNEMWATQGQDTEDLAIAIQMGWTDLITIAKHQGYAMLHISSETQPAKSAIGLNRMLWTKKAEGSPDPEVSFLNANAPIREYQDMIMELTAMMLTTNDMNPKEIGGTGSARTFSSGFQALIESADIIEARKASEPVLRDAELDTWEILKRWHNWMFDNNALNDDARAFGKFSDNFELSIKYTDAKPLESEDDRIKRIKELKDLSLITQKDAIRIWQPSLSDEEADQRIQEIEQEKEQNMARFQSNLGPAQPSPEEDEDGEES